MSKFLENITLIFGALAIALGSCLIALKVAHGAEASPIHVSGLAEGSIQLVFAVLAGAVTFISYKLVGFINAFTKKAGFEVDDKIRGYLEAALYSAVEWAEKKALAEARDALQQAITVVEDLLGAGEPVRHDGRKTAEALRTLFPQARFETTRRLTS